MDVRVYVYTLDFTLAIVFIPSSYALTAIGFHGFTLNTGELNAANALCKLLTTGTTKLS